MCIIFFCTVRGIYNRSEQRLLVGLSVEEFAFHCQTKTLRRIDMELVTHCPANEELRPFISGTLYWRRESESYVT